MSASLDIEKFVNSLENEYLPAARRAWAKGVYTFGNYVIGQAQIICPIDLGNLAASGTVSDVKEQGGIYTVEIGFNTSYAAAVHERLDLHHESPTQAKYLETPLRASAPKFSGFVIAEIKKELPKQSSS